jgi:FtsP/CotA-like multicopper oxidase with cupredoxin domain
VIAPGDSFVARFTPPRAGTFIYHTHVDEERQQPAGLAGAIIVLERGERYDAATDVAIIATAPREQPDSGVIPKNVLLNGNTSAEPLELRAGVRYRLRLINMTTRHPGLRFQLAEGGTPVRWRRLAKDGATLPEARQVEGIARQPVSIGETADVELILPHAGELLLMAQLSDGSVVGMLPIHVRAPGAGGR